MSRPVERVEVDCAILGAGVVGLAVAEAISRKAPRATVVVIERHARFGEETSSRSSEVVHAGLYYEGAPIKARTCVAGRRLLGELAALGDVPFRECGKLIVATEPSEVAAIEAIALTAAARGVPAELLGRGDARARSGNHRAEAALWSPTTAIVDSHLLMARLEAIARGRGVTVMYRTSLARAQAAAGEGRCGFVVVGPSGDEVLVLARAFVNAAGLGAARVANAFRWGTRWVVRPCRGRYFSLAGRLSGGRASLVYPVPGEGGALGIHLTLDLAGRCRLGPDVDWSRRDAEPDDPSLLRFDEPADALVARFVVAGERLLPGLSRDDLAPDFVGVRPKLFERVANGELPVRDFVVAEPLEGGCDFHLLGIDSPGLTAALALAEEVAAAVAARLR